MSTNDGRQPASEQAWLREVNAALQAVKAMHDEVSRENGNTARLIWQMRCLKQARSAWLAGNRDRAREWLAQAMNPDGEPVATEGSAPHPSLNGQAGGHSADGPAAQKAIPGRTDADTSQNLIR